MTDSTPILGLTTTALPASCYHIWNFINLVVFIFWIIILDNYYGLCQTAIIHITLDLYFSNVWISDFSLHMILCFVCLCFTIMSLCLHGMWSEHGEWDTYMSTYHHKDVVTPHDISLLRLRTWLSYMDKLQQSNSVISPIWCQLSEHYLHVSFGMLSVFSLL